MEPELLVTDMPEIEPADTDPDEVLLPMEALLMTPEPETPGSSLAVMEPELPVTDMPEIEPADTDPDEVLLPMVVLLIMPEPELLSGTAVMLPELLPTLRLSVVP
jgi:hypothetical protein